ncbi:transglycosylase SLT domain-containing protein [Streptomyces sp. NPDC002754]
MAGTAGVALGVYGLAMKNAVTEAQKFADEGKTLTASQSAFIASLDRAKTAVSTFGSSFKSETLTAASAALNGVTNIMHRLEPVARAIAPEITKVAQEFEKWTKSSSLKEYIQLIQANAVPAIQKFIDIGKDVGRVLGDAFKAFLPVGQNVLDVIKKGADELRKWADGGGFQRFLAYVTASSGPVNQFFKALGDALRNVGVAMRGLGEPSLKVATALLQMVAALPPGVIQAMAVGFVIFRTAVQGAAIASTAFAVGSRAVALGMALWSAAQSVLLGIMIAFDVALLPALGIMALIVVAIAAIGFGIYELVTHWSAVWNALKTATVNVWHALQTAWHSTVSGLTTAWNAVSGALVAAWHAVWNGLRAAFNAVVTFLGSRWGWLIAIFGPIGWLIAIAAHWKQVWGAIKVTAEAVWNALRTAWTATVNALRTAWNAASNALRTAWNAVWNSLRTGATAVWNALRTGWQAVVTTFRTVWTTVGNALRTAWQTVWNAMRTVAQAVWNALRAAWQTFLNTIRTAWNTISAALRTAWQTFWNALRTAAQTVWNAVRTAWRTFLNAIRTTWNTVSAALKAAWTTFWNALKTGAQAVWDAMKTAWNAFTTAVNDLWNKAAATLKKAWEDAWNAMKSTASTIWDQIKKVISDAVNKCIDIVNGLIGAWNAVAGAVHLPTIGKVGHVGFAEGGVAGEAKGFATGGVLPGYSPGTDNINAILSPGEGILVPEAVASLGSDWVHNANHYFSNGRAGYSSGSFSSRFGEGGINGRMAFASGGIVKFAGGGDVPNPTGGMAGEANPNKPSSGGSGGSAGMGGDAKKYEKSGTTNSDNPLSGLIGKAVGIGKGMFGLPDIASVTAAFMKWINAARSLSGFISPVGGALGGVGTKMLKTIVDKIKSMIQAAMAAAAKALGGAGGTKVSGKVGNLRGVVIQALKNAGYPVTEGNIAAMLQRIQIESGGNPNAINNWDINAKNGTPSIGLAQVIGPTFAAYGSGNIYDPVDNVTASLNYIKARYGGRIPTGKGGYAIGTPGATRGWAMVGEQGPEMINFRGGESVTNNSDLVRAIGSGSGGGPVHIDMPIHVAGNLDKAAVEKLDTEVLPKLRLMLSKGTGARLT